MKTRPHIIAVTGTKGKTSIVFILDFILRLIGKKTLCINSEGLFKNGKLIKNNDFFLKKYQTSANACGLGEIAKIKLSNFDFVLLESSYSSCRDIEKFSLKNTIDLAILTNIYWDHIDGKIIKNRADLINKKYRILKTTKKHGFALIYTGDKKNSVSYKILNKLILERPDLKIIGYQKTFLKKKLPIKRAFIKNDICYLEHRPLLNLNRICSPLKLRGSFFDLNMLPISLFLNHFKINPREIYKIKNLCAIVPGRFNFFEKNNFKVILDSAHEIKSLTLASKLLKKNFKNLKIKALIRFSYYRNDSYIKSLVKKISTLFDSFIVYDKSISRPSLGKIFTNAYKRNRGAVGKLVYNELIKNGARAIKINDEIGAIRKSIKSLKKNEVLYIIGDQLERDIETIKRSLNKKIEK